MTKSAECPYDSFLNSFAPKSFLCIRIQKTPLCETGGLGGLQEFARGDKGG